MAKFTDDFGYEVNVVTAEQHALDNPGHILVVYYGPVPDAELPTPMLNINCSTCDWWDQQGVRD